MCSPTISASFLRTLATPEPIKDWSLTSLKEKLIKIGAKVVSHGRYVALQMAEVAIARTCSRRYCGSSVQGYKTTSDRSSACFPTPMSNSAKPSRKLPKAILVRLDPPAPCAIVA